MEGPFGGVRRRGGLRCDGGGRVDESVCGRVRCAEGEAGVRGRTSWCAGGGARRVCADGWVGGDGRGLVYVHHGDAPGWEGRGW